MTRPNPIVEAVDNINTAFDEYKRIKDAEIGALQERIELLEAGADRPHGKVVDRETAVEAKHRDVFLKWVRSPRDQSATNALAAAQSELIESKNVVIGTDAAGGFAVPQEISRSIEQRVLQLSPFRGLVKVQVIGTSDYHHLLDMRGTTSGWVGEGGTRSETGTPELRDRVPTMGTLYAYPRASEESLDDIFFNVQDWLVESVADEFASQETTAIISGNGTNRPTGVLNTTPVTTGDDDSPLRAAGVIEYLPLIGFGSPLALTADTLVDMATSALKERYLLGEGVAWLMNRFTLSVVRRLKDQQDQYLWQPSLAAGTPSTLLGYPVYTTDAMPSIADNAFPIIFGNWRRGYLLTERFSSMRIVVDQVTTPGQVKFYVRKRVGGCTLNNDALKAIRISET